LSIHPFEKVPIHELLSRPLKSPLESREVGDWVVERYLG
jgi:hypothetical protein